MYYNYKRFLNNPTAQTEFLYKTSAKKIRLIISLRVAKAKSNVKMSSRLLNEILNKKSSKQNLPIVFKSGNQELSDPAQIVEQFCRYFTNIGPSLGNNLPISEKSYCSFLSGNFVNSLIFEEISQQEVINLCSSLHSGTATGFDNVPISLIKETIT